jgi:hypothetical protein
MDNHSRKFYLNGKYMDYIIKSKLESNKNMSFNIFLLDQSISGWQAVVFLVGKTLAYYLS